MMASPQASQGHNGLKRPTPAYIARPLKPEEEELINRLVYFQLEYEFPKEEDLKKVYHVPLLGATGGDSESDSLFRHITEMTILTVNLIVEFCKHLPGFASLEKDDQVVILKGCSSEVMMLRAARRYVIVLLHILYTYLFQAFPIGFSFHSLKFLIIHIFMHKKLICLCLLKEMTLHKFPYVCRLL